MTLIIIHYNYLLVSPTKFGMEVSHSAILEILPYLVVHPGEARCLDVKILSRSYDAKLIVCRCSLLENEEVTSDLGLCDISPPSSFLYTTVVKSIDVE